MTPAEMRAHVKLMVEFLSEQQENMTDQAIAIEAAREIFDFCMRPEQTINHALERDGFARIILEAIKKSKRI
jgi:hypothetical protein